MKLSDKLIKARAKVWEYQKNLQCFPDCVLAINNDCWFDFATPDLFLGVPPDLDEPFLHCFIDEYTLLKILHRDLHWNDNEVAMGVMFNRVPNIHNPSVHTLMSFFHL